MSNVVSFAEWWKSYSGENKLPENVLINIAYKAGTQSRQTEIDELQNRIDDVAKKLESIKTDNLRPRWRDYDEGWRDCAITVLSDLKGKENEH